MAEQINLAATQTRSQIRSTFIPPRPFEHSFTCNTGEVIPAFCTIEVQPHETWGMKVSTLVRLQTTQAPTMGRPYQCWAAYYTPHNQVWDNWDAFMGEVKDAAWETATVYTIPQISFTEGNPIEFDTICDHFGWRPGENQYGFTLGRLKLNHYLHICNEWLRDPNVEAPIKINTTDATIEYVAGGDFTVGGTPYKINRKADYFSVNLPEPQRGDPGIISLGDSAPVEIKGDGGNIHLRTDVGPNSGVHTLVYSNNEVLKLDGINDQTEYNLVRWGKPGTNADVGLTGTANLSSVSSFEINTLRHEAILQQIRETDARVGSRAYEILWGRWGVEADEFALKRPRLLFMHEEIIPINQVPNTTLTDTAKTGDLGGFGYNMSSGDWETHSFKYHGCLMILFWIRTEHKYQQGIPREDMKKDRFEFWHPEFDGEGDQPTYTAELFANAETINNRTIFGYNERGAEYKEFPSIISGELRSEHPKTLDSWHYADYYENEPTLSNEWMKESPENVDRTIWVTSNLQKQWKVDFALELQITRNMRVHSIPGIDRL
jgi:hypothetical protein